MRLLEIEPFGAELLAYGAELISDSWRVTWVLLLVDGAIHRVILGPGIALA